ncbi:MAG: hypothetical protein ABMA02_07390 [Saprospiraceae bacterium]
MRKTLSAFACLLLGTLANAQPTPSSPFAVSSELSNAISGGKSQFVRTFDDRFRDATKGSPFLFDEWVPGTLLLRDNSITGDSLLYKFDTYRNEVWARKIGGDSVIPYSEYIREVELQHPDGRAWQFKKYALDSASAPRFYQPIYDGVRYTLIKDERKLLVKANFVERGVYTTGLPYDRFEGTVTEYYIQVKKGHSFGKIALKTRDLTDLAPGQYAEEVAAFCKKEKIPKKLSEQEAAKLLGFIDR